MCSRIVVGGPKLWLNAASAQAVGLALHELATNAGKYAFDGCRSRGYRLGDRRRYLHHELDRARGTTMSGPQGRGFGTVVIEAMVERNVDRKVELVYPHQASPGV
jgi:two-component sensor histidine kinase